MSDTAEIAEHPASPPPSSRPVWQRAAVRSDIQALRALAVLSVLLFHLWPTRLPGGFVGVDVFFVVSGFLITAHLLKEQTSTGRIDLGRFWARRARRLLPASMLVLLVTAAGVYLFVPPSRWPQFGGEIVASALYGENWVLAWQAVDYMALSNVKSPTQHFWTLGVEEQFYIVWPLLLILLATLSRWLPSRWLPSRWRVDVTLIGLVLVVLGSLAHSVVFTAASQSMAYFFTTTRVWEFGFGALLAALAARGTLAMPGPRAASALSWTGIALIVVAVLAFGAETPFPSFTALLPVAGTCLVIVAGTPRARLSPARLMGMRPVQFLGDVSYGVYLWHWPLIVLIPYALGRDMSSPERIGVLAASIALGWASKVFVEDPMRSGRVSAGLRPRLVFVVVAALMALVVVVALPATTWRSTPVPHPGVSDASCLGAAALTDEACGDPDEAPLVADLASFPSDVPPKDILECEVSAQAKSAHRCDFGDVDAPRIAILGDSHATRWVEAVRDVAADEGWSTSTFLISGCPAFVDAQVGTAWGYPETADNCRRLSVDALAQIESDPSIDAVLLTNRTRLYIAAEGERPGLAAVDVAASIDALAGAGKTVAVLQDPPEMSSVPPQGGGSAADCLSRANAPTDCTLARSAAAFADPLAAAAKQTGALLISLDDAFCDAELCYSQIGGLVVYSDDNHVSRSFAASTQPLLASRLAPIFQEPR